MTPYLWIVPGLILVGLILLYLNAVRASGKLGQELDRRIEPALKAVIENSPSANELLLQAASQVAIRSHLYQRLYEQGRAELFPSEYRAPEKIAESALFAWLMHPNELNAEPAEIELASKIVVQEDNKTGQLFLFRFRSTPEHWAAQRGWMAGISGPYWEGETEIGGNSIAFSELTPFEKMTEMQHVEFLKNAMNKKWLVLPC